jgi:CYTH domain-containing protein
MVMKEIERKFLVVREKLPKELLGYQVITQAYLHDTGPMTRIRIVTYLKDPYESKAFLTFKGPGLLERDEIEFEMPLDKANEAIHLWGKGSITKTRYVYYSDVKWEIDFFQDHLQGLVIAEVELESKDQKFIIPEWISREVTDNPEYTNVRLAQKGECPVPPAGWRCTRKPGHDGPCAAVPIETTNTDT